MSELKENKLDNNYPVYEDYLYVADGEVIRAPFNCDIAQLKAIFKADEITNCDIEGRDLWDCI